MRGERDQEEEREASGEGAEGMEREGVPGLQKVKDVAMWRVEGDGNGMSARRMGTVLIHRVRAFLCTP